MCGIILFQYNSTSIICFINILDTNKHKKDQVWEYSLQNKELNVQLWRYNQNKWKLNIWQSLYVSVGVFPSETNPLQQRLASPQFHMLYHTICFKLWATEQFPSTLTHRGSSGLAFGGTVMPFVVHQVAVLASPAALVHSLWEKTNILKKSLHLTSIQLKLPLDLWFPWRRKNTGACFHLCMLEEKLLWPCLFLLLLMRHFKCDQMCFCYLILCVFLFLYFFYSSCPLSTTYFVSATCIYWLIFILLVWFYRSGSHLNQSINLFYFYSAFKVRNMLKTIPYL